MGTFKYSFRGLLVFCGGAALVMLCGAATAEPLQYPISIPQECIALAQREGMPSVISNKVQAVKAKYKLYRMSRKDPLVRQCRSAVRQAELLLKEQAKIERATGVARRQ
jgi:hypothetical protein